MVHFLELQQRKQLQCIYCTSDAAWSGKPSQLSKQIGSMRGKRVQSPLPQPPGVICLVGIWVNMLFSSTRIACVCDLCHVFNSELKVPFTIGKLCGPLHWGGVVVKSGPGGFEKSPQFCKFLQCAPHARMTGTGCAHALVLP